MIDPEFTPEFYKEQIEMMEERYSKYFLKCKLSWNKYNNRICKSLKYNQYWIWIYYCGFEKFLQETHSKPSAVQLETDADNRIARIIGDFYKNQNYVKSL